MTDLQRLRALATTLRDDLQLKGRWRWFGHIKPGHCAVVAAGPYLATTHHGRMYVLGFGRLGMQGAQPVFPHPTEGQPGRNILHTGAELPVFEVAPDATSVDDPRVYRDDITGFRTPVAEYLAAVDAETVLSLLDRIEELEQQLAASPAEEVPAS